MTSSAKGFTKKQAACFWCAFGASCAAQGLPADAREAYRKTVMMEEAGAEHMADLNRTAHYDAIMLRLALDAQDYETAAKYTAGDERRLAKIVEVCATQIMQCQGTDPASASAYVAGLIQQARFPIRQDGTTYWMDLCAWQIHAAFLMLDTHRRRLLTRAGWTEHLKFNVGYGYVRHADGGIQIDKYNPPPPSCFRVNIKT
jgi:hypothetical protein